MCVPHREKNCGLVMPYGDRTLVNIGSGNGLVPDGTKPLPEPMLTDHQWSPMTFILGQFHKRCLNHQWLKSVWKLHVLKFNSNFPGANELMHWPCGNGLSWEWIIGCEKAIVWFARQFQFQFVRELLLRICNNIKANLIYSIMFVSRIILSVCICCVLS